MSPEYPQKFTDDVCSEEDHRIIDQIWVEIVAAGGVDEYFGELENHDEADLGERARAE